MASNIIGDKILITNGKNSGRTAQIAYIFFEHKDGYRQMEHISGEGWAKIFWVVPDFDHCGRPQIVDLRDGEFNFI